MMRLRYGRPFKSASRTRPAVAGVALAAALLLASRPAGPGLASGDRPGFGDVLLHLLVPADDGYEELDAIVPQIARNQ